MRMLPILLGDAPTTPCRGRLRRRVRAEECSPTRTVSTPQLVVVPTTPCQGLTNAKMSMALEGVHVWPTTARQGYTLPAVTSPATSC